MNESPACLTARAGRRLALAAAFLAAVCATGFAQRPDSFATASPQVFLDELGAYLTAGKRPQAESLHRDLARRFSGYAPEQQAAVTRVTNAMLAAGMSPAPYFEDYLEALAVVPFAGEAAATFVDWHAALAGMLASLEGRRFGAYANFLDFSRAFFADGSLRRSSGLAWATRARRFNLEVSEGQPVIRFDTVDLVGTRRSDSIAIRATRGAYYPAEQLFRGRGGKVYWDRHGIPEASALLAGYELDVTSSLYSADSARMTYPTYFGDERVWGKLSDKITSTSGDNAGTYPRFSSYENVLVLTDIGEGLTYRGGFRLQGSTVFGDSQDGPPAVITLANEAGKVIYRGVADGFVIRRGERIVGDQVTSAFFHGVDSIVHPSVNLRYDIPERVLTLTRGERAADRNPFYSSQQDVNVDAEEVKIYVARDSVLFGEKKLAVAKGSNAVNVESLQYFSGAAYNRYQNIATYNPLSVVRAVAEREGRELDGEALAQKIDPRFSLSSVQSLYFDLVSDGFIEFDVETGRVYVKDKIFHFVDAAQGKVDFDGLRVASETAETNAALDLQTGAMLVQGVRNLELSRKQRVAMVPLRGQLVMQANRNIDFDGQLYAGYAVLEGKDFHFEYEPYAIRLDSARYLDFFVPVLVEEGVKRPEPVGIASRIEHVGGTILVDAPGNKAGREDIPVFPSLQTEQPSYVYYDLPSNHDTAYTRDSFYFELAPFSFNSLDAFEEADLRFRGTMYSADIFPPYPEEVYVREDDRSLGHATETPPEGWPTYQRKGLYTGGLDLSNRGYFGEGKLNYLTAEVESTDLLFRPKQLTGTAELFAMTERRGGDGPDVPQARGADVALDWLPYRDSMYVRSDGEPFDLFAAEGHTLEGQLILTPSGLKGQGVHDWPLATLRSELIEYGSFSAGGDTLALAIKTAGGDAIALEAANVAGTTDFDAQRGQYRANDEFLVVDLPANLYRTSMNEFEWDIASREIRFASAPGKLGQFVSADPERDSLFFAGETALYNLAGSALEIGGVPVVRTADALVYPADGAVSIGEGGEMQTLVNARIVADTVTKYHVIDSATVDIQGRKAYTARGYYRYDLPGKAQRVRFEEVVGERVGKGARSEKATVTRASGEVIGADDFYVDERTRFKGVIALDASRPELTFDGFAQLDAPGVPRLEWFSVNTPGDKADLRIPYDLPRSPQADDLYAGVYLSRVSAEAYPVAFQPTHSGQDRYLIDVSEGLLDYDAALGEFRFGDSLTVLRQRQSGQLMTVNATTGEVAARGRFALGSELDYIALKSAGEATTGFQADGSGGRYAALAAVALVSLDLIVPDKLLNLVAADIQASGFDLADVNYGQMANFLPTALANWQEGADSSAVQAAKGGSFVLPKGEPKHSFVFPRLRLTYNGEYQSFLSEGGKLDLAYVNGTPLHKRVEGRLEVKMPGSGDDRVYLWLKAPSDAWYFFGFKQGILNVASSSARFMESLEGLKAKELALKMDDGEIYEIIPVTPGTANAFVSRHQEGQ